MLNHYRALKLLSVMMLVTVSWPALPASEAQRQTARSSKQKAASKQEGRVAGIMFDYDRKNHWMTVKADGEDAPVKYLIDPSNTRLARGLETVFNASRVRLTYKQEGDSRRLTGIERQVLRASGTVSGTVVAVHDGFWLELKPRNGVANAFAPGANYNDQAFMARLALKPGDSVTIQFTTDFERHRIVALRKNAVKSRTGSKSGSPVGTGKEKN